MELVEELKGAKTIIWVLTGNGPDESKVLKGAARKYNGSEKVLFFPMLPRGFHYGAGLAILKITKIYVSKYNATKFLCLIDKEHVETAEAVGKEIKSKLREFGVEVINIQVLSAKDEEALFVEGKVGAHNFTLCIAINGREKCIEENIAKLLEARFGESVKPTKEGIKSALKKYRIDIEQLINDAKISEIKPSFPAMHAVLSRLESDE